MTKSDRQKSLVQTLFPNGRDFHDAGSLSLLMEQYKTFVTTSENLVARRQRVNAFFLSANAPLFSVAYFAIKHMKDNFPEGGYLYIIGLFMIAIIGLVLCIAWEQIIKNYARLNSAKFDVICLIEDHLPAAAFRAEWEIVGKGKDAKKYKLLSKMDGYIPKYASLVYIGIIIYIVAMLILRFS